MAELDNPFVFLDGHKVVAPRDWPRRRGEIERLVLDVAYGGLPPEPAPMLVERLHTFKDGSFDNASYTQYRLTLEGDRRFHFRLDVMLPSGAGAYPCVLTGDGCFRYVTDKITLELMRRKIALAVFSRTEIAPDVYSGGRNTGLYQVCPGTTFGAIAAWAWGFHRCVDALVGLPGIDPERIAVTGHSRGGKAALLAGATDERVALTAPNGSGAGGAGSFKWQGPESETIADLQRLVPYWFGPKLWEYAGREAELPFDQHYLKALAAPRALLTVECKDDRWSNPSGTYQTHAAAREVFEFLGARESIGIWFRGGRHDHGPRDWRVFLDFMEWRLRKGKPRYNFNQNPFPGMELAFKWKAPGLRGKGRENM